MTRVARRIPGFKGLGLAAAIAAVLLLSVGPGIWHYDAPGSAANCPICHAAHISALPGVLHGAIVASATVTWLIPAEVLLLHPRPAAVNPPPRAPPI